MGGYFSSLLMVTSTCFGDGSQSRQTLAIRLAWGALLLYVKEDQASSDAFDALRSAWSQAPRLLQQAEDALLVDEVWQVALEVGYQRNLAQRLLFGSGHCVRRNGFASFRKSNTYAQHRKGCTGPSPAPSIVLPGLR